MFWESKKDNEIQDVVLSAVSKNVNFRDNVLLGVPGTHLDEKVFPLNDTVGDNPFLTAFVANPNHIGMHTNGESEIFFAGTHGLENDVIRICAEEIMRAEKDSYDGYISSGGTEANIQGVWQLRNFYIEQFGASVDDIAILHSNDTHYSVYKAANLLNINEYSIPVENESRAVFPKDLRLTIEKAVDDGIKYFIVFLNMGTTMFGSVDDIELFVKELKAFDIKFNIHIDGAFGGFIYPFTNLNNKLCFKNPFVSSITMDAHKMLQAPYGTGIFLSKREFSEFTHTKKASYVKGQDSTLCGSRSGANAISVWMILSSYGSEGGKEFCRELLERTNILCDGLKSRGVNFYRNKFMNIVTIPSTELTVELARKYHLVLDTETNPKWFKIVVMDHIKLDAINLFLAEL